MEMGCSVGSIVRPHVGNRSEFCTDGEMLLHPDQSVQAAIHAVFEHFAELGSARRVLQSCARNLSARPEPEIPIDLDLIESPPEFARRRRKFPMSSKTCPACASTSRSWTGMPHLRRMTAARGQRRNCVILSATEPSGIAAELAAAGALSVFYAHHSAKQCANPGVTA